MTKVWLRDDDSEEDIFKVAKKLKADYVEDDNIYFICPIKYGTYTAGIEFSNYDNFVGIGIIQNETKNFKNLKYNALYLEEQTWVISVLTRIKFHLKKK